MLLQIVLGGTAGLAVLIKLYWQRLLLVFGMHSPSEKTPPAKTLKLTSRSSPTVFDAAQSCTMSSLDEFRL